MLFYMLGSSKCEYLSISFLEDAYHTINLSDISKPYCGILHFGSTSYVYQRMSMALSTSSAICHSYINAIPSSIPDRSKNLANMDDSSLNSSQHGHLKFQEGLLKV